VKQEKMDVKRYFEDFFSILSEDELEELGKKYGVEYKRKRKLPLVPFFWLMVLSAIEADSRGCLSKLVAFFVANFSRLYPGDKGPGLSRDYSKSKFLQTCKFLPATLLS
jgi:hypothetical protein